MKKLNNKGYLLVEIIVASVLAMTIAYFLIELTLNLKAKNDDVFVDTILVTDKVLMTNQIMNDINKYKLTKVSQNADTPNIVDLTFNDITKRITIAKIADKYVFQYGVIDSDGYVEGEYYKEFNASLDVSNPLITTSCYENNEFVTCNDTHDKGLLKIVIDAYTLYSDVNYGVSIEIPYNTKDLVVETIKPPDNFTPVISNITERGFTINAKANSQSPIKEYEYYVDDVLKCKTKDETCGVDGLSNNKDYVVYVKATNEFNLSTNSNRVNVTLKQPVSYMYYSTSTLGSTGLYSYNPTIHRCNSDGSNCSNILNLNGYVNTVGGAFGPVLFANSQYLYYGSIYYNNGSISERMELYRCNLDGSNCSKITNVTGYVNTKGGAFGSKVISNSNYLFYTSLDDNESSRMGIYRCKLDGSNCNKIASAYGYVNAVGGSYGPMLHVNDQYLYYGSATPSGIVTSNAINIYRCNSDGSNCSKIISANGYENAVGGSFGPDIVTNSNYMYYTSVNGTSGQATIYRCGLDGSNCSKIASDYGYINAVGGSYGPMLHVNDQYLYYGTTSLSGIATSSSFDLYRCNTDGSNCSKFASAGGYEDIVGGAFGPTIICNHNNLFYTAVNGTSGRMNLYRCELSGKNCSKIADTNGHANATGGSFGPIVFTFN